MKELPQAEWDFSTCPEKELYPCMVYESARDRPDLIEEVEKRRQQAKTQSFDGYFESFPPVKGFEYLRVELCFFYFPEWPKRPYLTISQEDRKERLRALRPAPIGIEEIIKPQPTRIESPGIPRFDLNLEYDPKSGFFRDLTRNQYNEYLLLGIYWSSSDKQILAALASALKKLRPKQKQFSNYRKVGAGSDDRRNRDALTHLGAYRLFEHYGFPRCRDVAGLFGDESAWKKARKRGETKIVSRYFPDFACNPLRKLS